MDVPIDTLTNYFIQQGILGIIILVQGFLLVWQQRRIDKKDTQIETLQEKRIADTNRYTDSFTEIAKEQVGAQKDVVNILAALKDTVKTGMEALQSLISSRD